MSTNKPSQVDTGEEIVISGIAGRFPKSNNVKELHENLLNKMDLGSNDHGRWNEVVGYDIPHRIGKVDNVEKFDSQFFDISAMEANMMSPASRMLLEHTYEALIDAGINPREIRGTKTGVFLGISIVDTANDFFYNKPQLAGLPLTGCMKACMANRISYWLDITGPAYNIDSGCSSSHFAVEKAYTMIQSGECSAAIVATSNLCLNDKINFGFYSLGVLAPNGYCKPFDKEHSGYMRSDTVAVIFLQKAKDARRVYATIVHAKTNCDGFKEEGITFPSSTMQQKLLEEVYEECGVSPNDLSYMEAHGTGTVVGDFVETMSIDKALCAKRNTCLLVGSIKSNIGHSEAASSVCQIVKILSAMENGVITPTIHYKCPREDMTAIIEGRIKIVTEPTEWKGGYVGINSFGFGGANCHVLLKSNPKTKINNGEPNDDLPRLVAVSGRTEEAVKVILNDVRCRSINAEYISLLHCIHSDNIEGHSYRGYTITGSKISNNTISKLELYPYMKRPICFIFSGLGCQQLGMNRSLMKLPVFATAIRKCDTVLKTYGIFITDVLTKEETNIFSNIIDLLIGLVGFQIGIVDLLTSIGIIPDYIIGHSIGELICGYADGCLTTEETILSAYFIGLAFAESKIIDGSMAEINLSFENTKDICPSNVDVVCYNSSHNFIVSGPTDSIKALLVKLQANNISVKEITCGHVPFHSHYVENARTKISKYLSRVLPQKLSRSSKWLLTSAPESSNISSAQYYTNYLLSPVLFAKAIRSTPKHAVTIEISPRNILQCVLKDSLPFTVTNVALFACSESHNIEIFLQAIGELYNARLQPRIANLYPTVEFPVSRGTQMISPLVRWDHSEDFYVMQNTYRKDIRNNIITININTSLEEFTHMTGHIVNGKNLLPATGYLVLMWKIFASLKKQEYIDLPIVFEDVKFLRATILPHKNDLKLLFTIQEGSNRFEIIEQDNAVVTGAIRFPENIENEKLPTDYLDQFIDDEEEMSTKDIYKELSLRGYQYTGEFRGLKSAAITGKNGHIAWKYDWMAFMDNMLQMIILGQHSRSLFVPTTIRKLIIDPAYHIQLIKDIPIEERQFPVRNYKHFDATISGGIEIYGTVAATITRRQKTINKVLEEYKFVAHRDLDTMSLQHVITMSMHIALECYNMINVKVIEFVEDGDRVMPENINSLFVNKILSDLPQIRHHIKLVTTCGKFQNIFLPSNISTIEFNKLPKNEKYLMVIGFEILTKNRNVLYEQLLSVIIPQGFLLTLEELGAVYDYSCLNKYELEIILEKQTNEKVFVLLRKKQCLTSNQSIVYVNNYEFSWVNKLKSIMNSQKEHQTNTRIILVAEGDFECGLLGLINCLQKEPGGEIIRGIFIQDKKAPAFSLEEPFYMKQLELDLTINVLRSGNVWGSYRHFPLASLEPELIQSANVIQTVKGDLSTLRWIQKKISFTNEDEDNLINIVYASINFRDIMIATGRLVTEIISSFVQDSNTVIGMEFAGFDTNGQRIMGLCSTRGIATSCIAKKYLTWVIPDKWTMEDAATVPSVYSTCYCALYMKGKMKKGDRVLIHSGTGGIGQAAIHLALYEGCEVFTTVGTDEKRQFIRKTFPSIPDEHIGNSRNTSFEQMIKEQTGGRGVDIVLNSLAEEKLQASISCLAKGGRFLELGKFDMLSNNPLDISVFSKGISFHGILIDRLLISNSERRINMWKKLSEGLENGAIKPLCRTIFGRNDIEAAFRYMAAGKHIGKIIIKVREEGESLYAPVFAYPRYYCLENKCYIILGGLGGFGLELADWLVQRGAKNLVLTSRTGIKNGYQRSRITLWQSVGVNVQIFKIDDTLKHDETHCESILKIAEKQAPVDAIFNLAVVLKDSIFQNQSPETFEDSFKSKAWMTKKMDELSRIICPQLRHFVVFSSVSCGRGNSGQTNYGMANSVMERICEKRMKEGLHGLAIQWGAIGDVGIVADMQEDNKERVIGGTLQQDISSCLDTLETFLLQHRPIVSSVIVAEKTGSSGTSINISDTVANILGLENTKMIAPNVLLVELGMDSMMTVEIKQTLERDFDVFLTAQDLRTLTFAKLKKMVDITVEKEEMHNINKTDTNNLDIFKILIRIIKNSDMVPDILVELDSKKEVTGNKIFLLPGIEGCLSVFKSIALKIKSPATCVQHGVLNIPDGTRSVIKSAIYILPHILEKMKDQKEFLIAGYSFGSLIAIELARLLEAKNFSGRLILIDGAPDKIKSMILPFNSSSQHELQNVVLLRLMDMCTSNNKMLSLKLDKCSAWEEKLEIFTAQSSKDSDTLTVKNQKLLCSTIYDHIIAVQDYKPSLLPRLKSPVTLLKPTVASDTFIEEDYGLHRITEGKVQVRYVEGTHITIMKHDEVVSAINGEDWTEE